MYICTISTCTTKKSRYLTFSNDTSSYYTDSKNLYMLCTVSLSKFGVTKFPLCTLYIACMFVLRWLDRHIGIKFIFFAFEGFYG